MITSLPEPCLIIPNYAARHLVLSVSPNMLPEQQLACCSVCVQSPWYHRWACSPILAGYNAGTYAVVLIIQHGIVQEGVYSVSTASASFLQFVTQFTQTWSVERAGTAGTYCGRNKALLTREGKVPVLTSFKWKANEKPYFNISTYVGFHFLAHTFLYSDLRNRQTNINIIDIRAAAIWICRGTLLYCACFVDKKRHQCW